MTTVERHPSTYHILSDAPPQSHRDQPVPTSIARRVPPAVPSPPQTRPTNSPSLASQSPESSRMSHDTERPNQWLFTEAEVASSPSILDGVLPIDERCRRAKGVNFIIQAGILLKLPQLTLATASVFFHRFYMRTSMVPEKGGQHHYNIAATALFLATKTEENCRKTKEIVIAVAKVAQKNTSLIIDEQSKEYWRWKDTILTFEEHMLEMLTFDVVLKSPYTCLFQLLQLLQIEDHKPMRNYAWTFINDSCMTPICLLMSPRDIAIAAIYFSAKVAKEGIEDDEVGSPWWEQLGGSPDQIIRAIAVMNDFWVENPLGKPDTAYGMSPLPLDDDLDMTRKPRNDGSGEGTPSPEDRRGSPDSPNGETQEAGETNGNRTVDRKTTSPIAPHDIPAPTTETDNFNDLDGIEPSGSSDTILKEAANDPATHDHGYQVRLPTANSKATPKRKSPDDAETEEMSAKRVKLDGSVRIKAESEEGELSDS